MTLLNLPSALRRKAASFMPRYQRTPEITRTFVETGDERCPIAGIWSRLPSTDAAPDEPEIAQPTMGMLFSRWALHLPCISIM